MILEYVHKFITSKRAGGTTESSLDNYNRCLVRFAMQHPAWPPTPEDIEQYLTLRRSQVKPVTVNGDYRALAVFLNWCCQRGFLADNPLQHVEKPRRIKTPPKPAPRNDIQKLFSTIEAQTPHDKWAVRDLSMFRLAYATGARASELASMRREDVNLSINGVYIEGKKSGPRRWLFFGRKTADALAIWLSIHPGDPALFTTRYETPITRRRIYYALQKWCRLANIRMTVHQLRHSYATHALRNGIDIALVQKQMGHANISTTAMYLGAEDEDRRIAHVRFAPE